MTALKICGLTNVEDARLCVELGVEAIGINLVPSSPRFVDVKTAREIADAIGDRALVVAVVADLSPSAMLALCHATGAKCLQLHGSEPPSSLEPMLPHAYKAIRVKDARDVEIAASYPGDHILVDAKVAGVLGGSGTTFDWSLVVDLARTRKLTLAGGLHAGNIAQAIAVVKPFAVDVASGAEIEGQPRRKDRERLVELVDRVRSST